MAHSLNNRKYDTEVVAQSLNNRNDTFTTKRVPTFINTLTSSKNFDLLNALRHHICSVTFWWKSCMELDITMISSILTIPLGLDELQSITSRRKSISDFLQCSSYICSLKWLEGWLIQWIKKKKSVLLQVLVTF